MSFLFSAAHPNSFLSFAVPPSFVFAPERGRAEAPSKLILAIRLFY